MKKFRILIILSLYSFVSISAQNSNLDNVKNKNWFLSTDIGRQMSGIKSEDFICSNYSPLFVITGGKWLNSKIAIELGYQGRYFNAIADKNKHYYDFYFVKSIYNPKSIFKKSHNHRVYELLFNAGFGYFKNHFYENSTIHGILGVSNNFFITNCFAIKFNISAIVGYDIYQGNKDILPAVSIGVIYNFEEF